MTVSPAASDALLAKGHDRRLVSRGLQYALQRGLLPNTC